MVSELYTDGVDEITVGGTIVRVDLVSLSPTERDANNAPKRVFTQRLIFSAEAFANSVDVMQNALQGLIDAGAITNNKSQAAQRSAVASLPSDHVTPELMNTLQAPNVSPNFRRSGL